MPSSTPEAAEDLAALPVCTLCGDLAELPAGWMQCCSCGRSRSDTPKPAGDAEDLAGRLESSFSCTVDGSEWHRLTTEAAAHIRATASEVAALRTMLNATGESAATHLKARIAAEQSLAAAVAHIAEAAEHAENRIADGLSLGAAVWRIALEDTVREARAFLATQPKKDADHG